MATGRQLSDAKFAAFRNIGLILSNPENELMWLQGNGATANNLSDAWKEMLVQKSGLGAQNYQKNTYWYKVLGDLGFEGQLNDRELAFWLSGGIFDAQPPQWTVVVPNFVVYENELPFTLNMAAYVFANPPVTGWATTKGTIPGGILTVTDSPGTYPITVTATNAQGSTPSNEFTLEIRAGTRPTIPRWSTIPNQSTVFGQEQQFDVKPYVTSHIPITDWILEPAVGFGTISNGVITVPDNTPIDAYEVRVTAVNANGPATSNQFQWIVFAGEGFLVEFHKSTMAGFGHGRPQQTTVPDWRAVSLTVPEQIPAFVGGQWDGADWMDQGVGYGIQVETNPATDLLATFSTMGWSQGYMRNNYCGQIVYHLPAALSSQADNARLYHFGPSDNGIWIGINAAKNLVMVKTVSGSAVATIDAGASSAFTKKIDIRFRVNESDGMSLWVNQGTKLTDGNTATSPVNLDSHYLGSQHSSNRLRCDPVLFRFVPASEDDATILAWPTWTEPLPVIFTDPVDKTVAGPDPVTFNVDYKHPYSTVQWFATVDGTTWVEANVLGGTGDTTRALTFSRTGAFYPNLLRVRATVTDELSRQVTSREASLTVSYPHYFHNFALSDIGEWTYERSGGTTVYDYRGHLITLGNNVPPLVGGRYDSGWHDEQVGYGIQLEPARTNLALHSNDPTQYSDLTGNITITQNYAIGPDGQQTASLLNNPLQDSALSWSNSPQGYGSVHLATPRGDGDQTVFAVTSILHAGGLWDIGNDWRRVHRQCIPDMIWSDFRGWIHGSSSATRTMVWGMQVEEGTHTYPTSLIPTNGASVTRAAPKLELSFGNAADLPTAGVYNDMSCQVTGVFRQDTQQLNNYWRFFHLTSLGNEESSGFQLQTGHDGRTWVPIELNGPMIAWCEWPVALNDGDIYDIRWRKRSGPETETGDGLTGWMWVNGVLIGKATGIDSGSNPIDCSGDFAHPINYIYGAGRGFDFNDPPNCKNEMQYVRFLPVALTDAEIEAWPTWTEPLPIIEDGTPPDLALGGTTPPPIDPPPIDPPSGGVIFETNFGQDQAGTEYYTQHQDYRPVGHLVWGFDYVKNRKAGTFPDDKVGFEITSEGEGKSTNALKIVYPRGSQPTFNLTKHLTGDMTRGHREIYIRWNVKFPGTHRFAVDRNLRYWKWLRLFQNAAPDTDGYLTENRADSGFIVMNWSGNMGSGYTDETSSINENDYATMHKGSAGGEYQATEWHGGPGNGPTRPGNFEHVGAPTRGGPGSAWEVDKTTGYFKDRNQKYHTIELHYKHATTATSADMVYELWFDGVLQNPYFQLEQRGGSRHPIQTLLQTYKGSGWNMFYLMDNMDDFNYYYQTEDCAIRINDIVISTDRIGHEYQAGNSENKALGYTIDTDPIITTHPYPHNVTAGDQGSDLIFSATVNGTGHAGTTSRWLANLDSNPGVWVDLEQNPNALSDFKIDKPSSRPTESMLQIRSATTADSCEVKCEFTINSTVIETNRARLNVS